MGCGAASGFVTGALVGAIGAVRYNIDDEFAWNSVDKKVLEYGNDNNRLADAAKYVSSGDYDISVNEHIKGDGLRGSEFIANRGDNGKMFLDPKDFGKGANFNAEKFYYTAWHEGHHNDMLVSAWQKEGGIGSLSNWANSMDGTEWAQHSAAQEYINTDPYRIKYYSQMSPSTKNNFIKPLTEKARNRNYMKMLEYYQDMGY